MPKKRAHIIVRGYVQGVGYRFEAIRQARALGLKGWVRNEPDGSVELLAEGEEEALGELSSWCRQGPWGARVSDMEVEWEEPREDLRDFNAIL